MLGVPRPELSIIYELLPGFVYDIRPPPEQPVDADDAGV